MLIHAVMDEEVMGWWQSHRGVKKPDTGRCAGESSWLLPPLDIGRLQVQYVKGTKALINYDWFF